MHHKLSIMKKTHSHDSHYTLKIVDLIPLISLKRYVFCRNPQFSKLKILFSSFGMKIILLQIDQKLTFNVFHILDHGHISKIEKNI